MSTAAPSYRLEQLTKIFPGIIAVKDVDLEVRKGEIHGIIGRNGAGKSVMVSMIAGVIRPTSGKLFIDQQPVAIEHYSPVQARELGVSLIPQEPLFALNLSVEDNIFMGNTKTRRMGFVEPSTMKQQVQEIADRLSVKVTPNQKIGDLPLEDQQLLAFGKALFISKSKVILLDEITASLSRPRKKLLLNFLLDTVHSQSDLSYTLISHHINEVVEFCHRVTVMRDGEAVATLNIADTNAKELADLIVGEHVTRVSFSDTNHQKALQSERGGPQVVLRTQGLTKRNRFEDVNLDLHFGEVIGFAGLDGSGKDELMEALVGLTTVDAGDVIVQGQSVRLKSPQKAAEHGIAYLPKKREEQAVIHNRSVEENALLSIYARMCTRLGLVKHAHSREVVRDHVETLRIKTPNTSNIINNLSGGNRQKVILSRVLLKEPVIYVLNEPTRGVDLSVKPEILSIIRNRLAKTGAVIVTSESEEELIDTCDQILILYRGKIQQILKRSETNFTPQEVYKATQGL